MAIATFSPASRGFRGKIGGLVFKHYRNKVVVTRAPTFTQPWSAAQKAGRTRFAAASAYARTVQADPLLRARYARIAARRGLTIRSAAISAYLRGETEQIQVGNGPFHTDPPRQGRRREVRKVRLFLRGFWLTLPPAPAAVARSARDSARAPPCSKPPSRAPARRRASRQ